MPKVIDDVVLPGMKVEGTAQEVAESIFEKIISPCAASLSKSDRQAAATFAYHIMGLGISQFAECVTTENFEKNMNNVVRQMVLNLKKERGELSN